MALYLDSVNLGNLLEILSVLFWSRIGSEPRRPDTTGLNNAKTIRGSISRRPPNTKVFWVIKGMGKVSKGVNKEQAASSQL